MGSLQESPTLLILRCRARHYWGTTLTPAPDGPPSNAVMKARESRWQPGCFCSDSCGAVRCGTVLLVFAFCLPPLPRVLSPDVNNTGEYILEGARRVASRVEAIAPEDVSQYDALDVAADAETATMLNF